MLMVTSKGRKDAFSEGPMYSVSHKQNIYVDYQLILVFSLEHSVSLFGFFGTNE